MATATRKRAVHKRPLRRRPGRRAGDAEADAGARARLLDAATLLFSERGIASTTMTQIAGRVGFTSAMVHYYFKNREQLLDAVVAERIQRFIDWVWEPLAAGADDPHVWVRTLVERLFAGIEAMPWMPPLWLREILNEGGQLRERMLRRIPIGQLKRFSKCIAAGQKNGSVNRELEPGVVFISILGLTMMPLATVKIRNRLRSRLPELAGIDSSSLARHVTALLAHGLGVSTSGAGQKT